MNYPTKKGRLISPLYLCYGNSFVYAADQLLFDTHETYQKLLEQLGKRSKDAILPVQIAYFTGLRLGEVAGLTWQDINLEEQYLTVRRSVRYNKARHKTEIGPTKRKKVRVVDFGDTLAGILKTAKKEQHKQRFQYGQLYPLFCGYKT